MKMRIAIRYIDFKEDDSDADWIGREQLALLVLFCCLISVAVLSVAVVCIFERMRSHRD